MSHQDLSPEDAGRGLQLANAAVGDPIAAAHGAVDPRTRVLAHTLCFPVLHGTHCPEQALHPDARGRGLICGGHGTQGALPPPGGRTHKPPALSSRPSWVGMAREERARSWAKAQTQQRKGQTRNRLGQGHRPRRPGLLQACGVGLPSGPGFPDRPRTRAPAREGSSLGYMRAGLTQPPGP